MKAVSFSHSDTTSIQTAKLSFFTYLQVRNFQQGVGPHYLEKILFQIKFKIKKKENFTYLLPAFHVDWFNHPEQQGILGAW